MITKRIGLMVLKVLDGTLHIVYAKISFLLLCSQDLEHLSPLHPRQPIPHAQHRTQWTFRVLPLQLHPPPRTQLCLSHRHCLPPFPSNKWHCLSWPSLYPPPSAQAQLLHRSWPTLLASTSSTWLALSGTTLCRLTLSHTQSLHISFCSARHSNRKYSWGLFLIFPKQVIHFFIHITYLQHWGQHLIYLDSTLHLDLNIINYWLD